LRYKREKIPLLKAVFSKDGTITAGNSSKINDGGCAIGNKSILTRF
jgi:acetyl-CoA C-acetyltransferase